MNQSILAALMCSLVVTGCATTKPTGVSHTFTTEDKSHIVYQFSMHTGVPNTPVQTVAIIYNTRNGFDRPIVTVNDRTRTASDEFLASVTAIAGSAAGATIGGHYMLQAAKAECPEGALCGTLVQVQNQAGATAGAEADATAN